MNNFINTSNIVFPIIPLIYNTNTKFDLITNILLIFNEVQSYEQLVNSCNQNTLTIVYSIYSSKQELLEIVDLCPNLNRLGIAFHDSQLNQPKLFLDNLPFFLDSDLVENVYSPNTQFIIDLINNNKLQHIDYLACNTLNYSNWVQYYNIIYDKTGVTVGASDNSTGNIKYGGDWILESNNENIKFIYFTDSIENYADTLDVTVLTVSTLITAADITNFTWPVTITGGTTLGSIVNITFGPGITFTNANQYFKCDGSYILFDGSTNDISINVTGWSGLIQNGTSAASGIATNVTIKNIQVKPGSSTLTSGGGYIIQNYFGTNISGGTFLISNCSNIGDINNNLAGGIIGAYCGYNMSSSSISILNCYNTGDISGAQSGGIIGSEFCNNTTNLNINISNCYNSGILNTEGGGGIIANCGNNATYLTLTISNCFNTGLVSGLCAGGIIGLDFGYLMALSTVNILNCYNTGDITGNNAGGIFGSEIGYNSATSSSIKYLLLAEAY